MRLTIFPILLLLSLLNCHNDTDPDPDVRTNCDPVQTSVDFELLFIGNSLTFANDLPKLVESTALAQGVHVSTKMVAHPNYGLEDHWNEGVIQELIKCGVYDFVIIQQGPSSQAYGRDSLLDFGGRIAQLCEDNDAKLAFFMVWPSLQNYSTFPGVIANYTHAANASNALLCPVGLVWKQYFDETNDFSYYGADGFHPSLAGSTIAAQVIVDSLEF